MVAGGADAGGVARGGLSPDGKWLAYGINRSNGNNELRWSTPSPEAQAKSTPFGTQADLLLRFEVARVQHRPLGNAGRSDARRQPAWQNKLGLMNLATGEQTVVDGIESFAFSPAGTWLAMRHYPPESARATGGAARDEVAAEAARRSRRAWRRCRRRG